MEIYALIVGIFLIGILLGFLISDARKRKDDFVGNIVVYKTDDKTVYTLEIDGDPEEIQFQKKAVFKVVPEKSDRE